MADYCVPTPRIRLDPPVYYAPRAKKKFVLNGQIDKVFWADVPYTSDFVDISGPDFPTPRFRTRAKICWDDTCIYIAARMEGPEIWATIEQRDSVMYYDNDFEVFFDPSSSTHSYLELEMNAKNTQWDLLLTKPYRDGGRSVTCWDIKGLETATHVEGALNDPARGGQYWSAEIRIPFASLMETYSKEQNPPELERCYPCRTAPCLGEFWRMNFSRVNWLVDVVDNTYVRRRDESGKVLPEDNWVWAPTGLIDIHYPEYWAFVFFTDHGEAMPIPQDELRKLALREAYYAQYAYHQKNSRFARSLEELRIPPRDFPITVEATSHLFELSCPSEDGGSVILRSDSFTYVE